MKYTGTTTVILWTKDLVIEKVAQLGHGGGARYLEVILGQGMGAFIAVRWRRKLRPNCILIDFGWTEEDKEVK